MSTSKKEMPPIPRPAPVEFAGQWVAWNRERTEVVAHGRDFIEVHREVLALGYPNAIFQKVRDPKVGFIGQL